MEDRKGKERKGKERRGKERKGKGKESVKEEEGDIEDKTGLEMRHHSWDWLSIEVS